MNAIELQLNDQQRGAFTINEGDEHLAEMAVGITGQNLIVYHTEVSPKLKGQGIGARLLAHMVDYARQHRLKVVPLCPYVHGQFEKHPDQYADVWNRGWHRKAL